MSRFYGLLSGPAFAISNVSAGLYFGKAASKLNRSKLLAVACIVWSLTSLATGSVDSLAILALMRFGLGVAQAATEPLIFSLLVDSFPAKKLPFANSVISVGLYIGGAISCLSVIFVGNIGWRGCFKYMSAFGVTAGLIALLTLKEPIRG